MQAASHEAMEASIAVCLQKSGSLGAGERDGDSAAISEEGSMQPVAQMRSGSGSGLGGPLQMTNVQVELAQEIASYMKAAHSDSDQVEISEPS